MPNLSLLFVKDMYFSFNFYKNLKRYRDEDTEF